MAERRIIQIAVVTDCDDTHREDRVYALASDGTVWVNANGWRQLPALPQPEPEPENPNGIF